MRAASNYFQGRNLHGDVLDRNPRPSGRGVVNPLLVDLVAVVLNFVTFGIGAVLFPLVRIVSIWAILAVQSKDCQVIT